MQFSKKQIRQIERCAEVMRQIVAEAKKPLPAKTRDDRASGDARFRRTGADLMAFKKMIEGELKKGAPVAELAGKHGVTPAYIYQLR